MRNRQCLSVAVAMTVCVGLAGCGSDGDGPAPSSTVTSTTVEATQGGVIPGPTGEQGGVTDSTDDVHQPGVTADELDVKAIITPAKDDPLVTALRAAADAEQDLWLNIAVEVPRAQITVAGPDGKTVGLRPAQSQPAVYAITVTGEDFYRQCPQPQLGLPDFHMCQTVAVSRDTNSVAALSEADKQSIGQDAFVVTTIHP